MSLRKVCCHASSQDIKVSDANVFFSLNFAIRCGGRADGNKFRITSLGCRPVVSYAY